MARILILAVSVTALLSSFVHGQDKKDAADKKPPIAPAEKLAEGWEEIDERLIFLMVRLANTESSLEAVEKVIAANSRKRTAKTSEAKRAIGENEKMDRKGGGPMKWNQFYGTTAEKFFYHPTDRNSTYHTETILSPQPPQNDNQTGPGIPSRQGLPVHQRPPQFDYIYKANETVMARADAEAAQLKNKVEALTERRQKLEQEQVALWIEIAFRVAAHFDLDKKPMFRFEPQLGDDADAESQLHAEILKSAASFMRVALAIVEEANTDQEATLVRIKPAMKEARLTLNDSWLRLGVDASDKTTTEGKFAALAKRLDDVSSNLTESYEVANEGDQEQDVIRKETFRGLLQESLIRYAQIILAMDEMATEMKDKWGIKPDLDKPFGTVSLANIELPTSAIKARDSKPSVPVTEDTQHASLIVGNTLEGWHTDSTHWRIQNGVLTGAKLDPNESGSFLISDKTFRDFELFAEFRLLEGNSGIQIRSVEQSTGLVTGPQADIAYQQDFRYLGCLTGERIQPEMIAQTSDETKARMRQVVNPNGWNSMKVSVEGRQAIIMVNNVNTVQTSLPDGYEQGVIALQLHGGGRTRIEFRKIEIAEITADVAFDPFEHKSVWTDKGSKLTVIDRRGGTFRARFETNQWARIVRGTVRDEQVSWLGKDDTPIKGFAGGDNYGTISKDENGYRMDVDWRQSNGESGTFTLRLNQ